MKELRGRTALVTGASRGIGVVIARALAAEGCSLVLAARTADALARVRDELGSRGVKALAVPTDLTVPAERIALVERAQEELGPIDVLVNNAGVVQWTRFEHQSLEDMEWIFATNVLAPFHLARLVLPGMIERGRGHIVTVASLAGKKGVPYEATYGASKAAPIEWTGSLRMELEGSGVGVSVVCPVYVSGIGMFATHGIPAPRLAGSVSPERVAKAVVRAIRSDKQEILVRPSPTRPLLALDALSPGLGNRIIKLMRVPEVHRRLAEETEATERQSP